MGHNIDLIELAGAPEMVKCPHCGMNTDTWYDDLDVECTLPQEKHYVRCNHCEKEFFTQLEFTVKMLVTKD